MAGKYEQDELFIALCRQGLSETTAEGILGALDREHGVHRFSAAFPTAHELRKQFTPHHKKYRISFEDHGSYGWTAVRIVSRCVEPPAPWVRCCVDGVEVKTCERKEPVENDYRCPVHPDGARLRDGSWVCSGGCHEIATGPRS